MMEINVIFHHSWFQLYIHICLCAEGAAAISPEKALNQNILFLLFRL